MRAFLVASAFVLFGFANAGMPADEGLELRISTPDHGVAVENLSGEGHSVILAGPRVSVVVREGMSLRVNDLNSASVSARLDRDKEWTVWEGSFEVELVENSEIKSRLQIRDATMILGRFDGDEGWTVEGD